MPGDIKIKISKEKFLFILPIVLEFLHDENAQRNKAGYDIYTKKTSEKKSLLTIKNVFDKLMKNQLEEQLLNELIAVIQLKSSDFPVESIDAKQEKEIILVENIVAKLNNIAHINPNVPNDRERYEKQFEKIINDEKKTIGIGKYEETETRPTAEEEEKKIRPSTPLPKKQSEAILVMIFIYLLAMKKDPNNEKYKEAMDIINQNKSFKDIISKEPDFSINTNELVSIKNFLRKQIKKNEGLNSVHLCAGMLNVLKDENREIGITPDFLRFFFLALLGTITCIPLTMISLHLHRNSENEAMKLIEKLAISFFGFLGGMSMATFFFLMIVMCCSSLNAFSISIEKERNQIVEDYSTLLFDPEVVGSAIFSLGKAVVDDKHEIIISIENNSLFNEINESPKEGTSLKKINEFTSFI